MQNAQASYVIPGSRTAFSAAQYSRIRWLAERIKDSYTRVLIFLPWLWSSIIYHGVPQTKWQSCEGSSRCLLNSLFLIAGLHSGLGSVLYSVGHRKLTLPAVFQAALTVLSFAAYLASGFNHSSRVPMIFRMFMLFWTLLAIVTHILAGGFERSSFVILPTLFIPFMDSYFSVRKLKFWPTMVLAVVLAALIASDSFVEQKLGDTGVHSRLFRRVHVGLSIISSVLLVHVLTRMHSEKVYQQMESIASAEDLLRQTATCVRDLDFAPLVVERSEDDSAIAELLEQITEKMMFFKPYLPQSLFTKREAQLNPESEALAVAMRRQSMRSIHSTSSDNNAYNDIETFGRRMVTLLNIKFDCITSLPTREVESLPESSLRHRVSRWAGIVYRTCRSYNGIVLFLEGDSILISFTSTEQRSLACHAAIRCLDLLNIAQEEEGGGFRHRASVVCGYQACGFIGDEEFKSFSVIGNLFHQSRALLSLAELLNSRILITHSVNEVAHCEFATWIVDAVQWAPYQSAESRKLQSPTAETTSRVLIYELLCQRANRSNYMEWIYDIDPAHPQAPPNTDTSVFNNAMQNFLSGEYGEARSQLLDLGVSLWLCTGRSVPPEAEGGEVEGARKTSWLNI